MNLITTIIQAELLSDEKVLWSGQPRMGIILRSGDIFMIPFSCVWFGIVLFTSSTIITSKGPFFPLILLIPFSLFGLYITVGRFFLDARQRAHTFYAITNKRIIIVSGLITTKVTSIQLSNLSGITLLKKNNGEGTILFGGNSPLAFMMAGFSSWPGMDAYIGFRFDSIADVSSVYNKIIEIQQNINSLHE